MAKRALVLGGGGPVGIAWEAGLLAGLAEGGVDLGAADLIVGTSAGAFVGAQIAMGKTAGDIAQAIIAEEARPKLAAASGQARAPDPMALVRKMQEAALGERNLEAVRQEIGAFALSAETMDEASFIASFGRSLSGLGDDFWPDRPFACTATDALTGAFVVWDRTAKVGLARAVASSCSVPGIFPPITIKGRRYIDGGMHSGWIGDLAKGHDFVVVVLMRTTGGDPALAERMGRRREAEIATLREAGSHVELIVPDEASTAALGVNLHDARVRPAAARAGLVQGRKTAAGLGGLWRG
jgi:NTE family protein